MTDISFRWRDYKSPEHRGTYLVVNNKQYRRISGRKMTIKEQNAYRKQLLLNEEGFLKVNSNTSRKTETEDHIREIKEGDLNIEISDIFKEDGKWVKEKREDRDIIAVDEGISKLRKALQNTPTKKTANQKKLEKELKNYQVKKENLENFNRTHPNLNKYESKTNKDSIKVVDKRIQEIESKLKNN